MRMVGAKVFLVEVAALLVALFGPNMYEIMVDYHLPLGYKAVKGENKWSIQGMGWGLAMVTAVALVLSSTILLQGLPATFIYFQF